MCGLFGFYSARETISRDVLRAGLFSLRHRGHDSFGVSLDNDYDYGTGKFNDMVDFTNVPKYGNIGIAHVRYATQGESRVECNSPFSIHGLKVAFNGTIENVKQTAQKLSIDLQIDADTELLAKILTAPNMPFAERVKAACDNLKGAFTFLVHQDNTLYAFRDPRGLKPLCYGMKDGVYYVASESSALDDQGITFVRDLQPGELLAFRHDRVDSGIVHQEQRTSDPFEYIYLCRPDSVVDGVPIGAFRHQLGLMIGDSIVDDLPAHWDENDTVVTDVPNSGNIYAQGFAEAIHTRYVPLFWRLKTNRSFIEHDSQHKNGYPKLSVIAGMKDQLDAHRVVVIDDSVVRGDTLKNVVVPALRKAGFEKIHIWSMFPAIRNTCPNGGIDFRQPERQLMRNFTAEEACTWLGVNSIQFGTMKLINEALTHFNSELKAAKMCDLCTLFERA